MKTHISFVVFVILPQYLKGHYFNQPNTAPWTSFPSFRPYGTMGNMNWNLRPFRRFTNMNWNFVPSTFLPHPQIPPPPPPPPILPPAVLAKLTKGKKGFGDGQNHINNGKGQDEIQNAGNQATWNRFVPRFSGKLLGSNHNSNQENRLNNNENSINNFNHLENNRNTKHHGNHRNNSEQGNAGEQEQAGGGSKEANLNHHGHSHHHG